MGVCGWCRRPHTPPDYRKDTDIQLLTMAMEEK
jgi:hypothetical protein